MTRLGMPAGPSTYPLGWGDTSDGFGSSPTATPSPSSLQSRHRPQELRAMPPTNSPQPYAPMRLLFVHERFGAMGGAEANVLVTATELKRRGHTVGLLHGPATGKEEALWRDTFAQRFDVAFAGAVA